VLSANEWNCHRRHCINYLGFLSFLFSSIISNTRWGILIYFFPPTLIPPNLLRKQSLQFVDLFIDLGLFNLSVLERVLLWNMDSFFNTDIRKGPELQWESTNAMLGNLAVCFLGLCCVNFRSPVKSHLNGTSGT